MLAPSVSYQICSSLLRIWTRVSFEQSWCCLPYRLQGVTQLSEAGSASMGNLTRLNPVKARSRSVYLRNLPVQLSNGSISAFLKPFGVLSPFAQGFFRPFPLLGWRGRGEAGAKRLLKKWFPVFCLQSAGGGGGGEGWVVLLSACRGVATIFNSAVIRPHCL